jgi:hypothetical protein
MLLARERYYVPVVILHYLTSDAAIRDVRRLSADGDACDFVVTALNAFIVDIPSPDLPT